MKPRILQIMGSFHNGGSERQAAALANALRVEGTFDVRLAVLDGDGPLRREAASFDDIAEFPLTSFYDLNFVRQLWRCAAYLRDRRIDIIHTHDFYTNVFGMAAATLARTRAKVASKRETNAMRSRMQERIEKLAFARADRILANSNTVKGHLAEKGIALKKVVTIYNGIDVDAYKTRRAKTLEVSGLSLKSCSKVVTLVANLRHDVKNVPMFLRAARAVAAEDANAHFVVAGEGELRTALETQARSLGLNGNVHFIGRCDDVPMLLAGSDICVLTSRAEGFSNSILEYMAAGRPVIATDVGGAAEAIVNGETGYLIDSDDDQALAERLTELLANKADASRMGKRARAVVTKRFSREAQVSAIVELYKGLL